MDAVRIDINAAILLWEEDMNQFGLSLHTDDWRLWRVSVSSPAVKSHFTFETKVARQLRQFPTFVLDAQCRPSAVGDHERPQNYTSCT